MTRVPSRVPISLDINLHTESIDPLTDPVQSDAQSPVRRVLIVDDEDTVRTALQASIETFDGFEVATAEDGEEGLEMIADSRYDILLVDLMMPVIDGFEVLRQVRNMEDAVRPDRVILVSGMADPTLQGNVRALGGDGILSKPFRLDDLRRLLVDELDPL